jgi:hypothetical protein
MFSIMLPALTRLTATSKLRVDLHTTTTITTTRYDTA